MIPDIEIANGVMSVVLNYFKMMPPDIKFDVVYFSEKEKTVQPQIEALGGRVYKINPPSAKGILKHEMSRFFAAHKNEWEALHIHAPHFAVFIAPQAKKAGIKKNLLPLPHHLVFAFSEKRISQSAACRARKVFGGHVLCLRHGCGQVLV